MTAVVLAATQPSNLFSYAHQGGGGIANMTPYHPTGAELGGSRRIAPEKGTDLAGPAASFSELQPVKRPAPLTQQGRVIVSDGTNDLGIAFADQYRCQNQGE